MLQIKWTMLYAQVSAPQNSKTRIMYLRSMFPLSIEVKRKEVVDDRHRFSSQKREYGQIQPRHTRPQDRWADKKAGLLDFKRAQNFCLLNRATK